MAITFTCYACNQVLKVGEDKAGKKARCVKCGTILTIPAGGGAEEEVVEPMDEEPAPRRSRSRDEDDGPRRSSRGDFDDLDDRPRRRSRDDDDDEDRPRRRSRDEEDDYEERPRRRSRDEEDDYDDRRGGKAWGSWPKVGVGFTLHTITGAVFAGCAGVGLIGLLLFFIGGLASSVGLLKAGTIIGAIGAILFVAVEIPALVAYILCLFSPNKRGAMIWAIVVLSLGTISLVFRIIWVLIPAINSFSSRGLESLGGIFSMFVSVYGIPIVAAGSVAGTIIVSILILLVMYAEYVLLPVYIGSVGKALKDRYVSSGAIFPLIVGSIAVALKLLVIILLLASIGSAGEGASKAMGIIISIVAMLAFGALAAFGLMYMRLSMQAKKALP